MTRDEVWRQLATSPSTDEREIRRAYARRLREVHPEDDAVGFMALRAAFEQALGDAQQAPAPDRQPPQAPPPRVSTTQPLLDALTVPDKFALKPDQRSRNTLTIDDELDEITLDELRRPELEDRLRGLGRLIALPFATDQERLTAFQTILASDAMGSTRLFAETEDWVLSLLSGNDAATSVLVEPAIAFFAWDCVGQHGLPPQGEWIRLRRDAMDHARKWNRPGNELHDAFRALHDPLFGIDRIIFRLAIGFSPKVQRVLAAAARNPALMRMLDPDALAWWSRRQRRPDLPPLAIWVLLLAPLLVGLACAFSAEESRLTLFFTIWSMGLLGLWAIMMTALMMLRIRS